MNVVIITNNIVAVIIIKINLLTTIILPCNFNHKYQTHFSVTVCYVSILIKIIPKKLRLRIPFPSIEFLGIFFRRFHR